MKECSPNGRRTFLFSFADMRVDVVLVGALAEGDRDRACTDLAGSLAFRHIGVHQTLGDTLGLGSSFLCTCYAPTRLSLGSVAKTRNQIAYDREVQNFRGTP